LYNIVVANRRKARDKLPIEVLGTYNPVPLPLTSEEIASGEKPYKHIELDFDRAKYWLGVGASVSDRVGFLFKRAGLLPQEWPNPNKMTQHIPKPSVKGPETVVEKEEDLFRRR
jgi:small subunit ribosomal protein S16